MKKITTALICILLTTAVACNSDTPSSQTDRTARNNHNVIRSLKLYSVTIKGYIMSEKVVKSNEEWKKILTSEQFHITREQGTEHAFTGATWNNHETGVYHCVCCGNDLFSSEHKYESGTGWPSFWQPVAPENVANRADDGFFMKRTEVICSRCDAHLGHVFNDGPKPTGLRYCMNSAAMKFEKKP